MRNVSQGATIFILKANNSHNCLPLQTVQTVQTLQTLQTDYQQTFALQTLACSVWRHRSTSKRRLECKRLFVVQTPGRGA